MRVGLIGLGMVADTHAAAIRDAGLTLGPVLGRNPDRSAAWALRQGGQAAPNVNTVVENSDFVCLLTPPDARDMFVGLLADCGVPILSEKPLERDTTRAQALVDRAANVPFGVCLQHRMRPAARALADALPELGRIGTVELRVPWWRDQSYYDAPGRGTWARDGGGVLLTQAIHAIDLMLQITGPVAAVQAMTATALHRMEAEDFAGAVLRFASGATGVLMASVTHYPGGTETLVVNAEGGSATLTGDHLVLHPRDGAARTIGTGGGTGGGADPMAFSHAWHQAVIADFADAVATGRAPAIPAASALPAHALIDAIQQSAREGRRVEVTI